MTARRRPRDHGALPTARHARHPWPALLLWLALAAPAWGEDRDPEPDWGPEQAAGRRAYKRGEYAEAERLLTEALERARRESRSAFDVSCCLHGRGSARRVLAQFEAAEPDLVEALRLRRGAADVHFSFVRQSLTELGLLESMRGRFAATAEYHRQSLEIAERAYDPRHPELSSGRNNLGETYRKLGRPDLAEPLLLLSLAAYELPQNVGDMKIAWPLNNLGLLRHQQGRQDEALALHQRALAVWERDRGKEHPETALSLKNIALVLNAQGNRDEARRTAMRSLAIREEALGPDHPAVAQTLVVLGIIERDAGRPAQAEAHFRRALEIRRARLVEGHLDFAETYEPYAALLRALGRDEEAAVLEAQAKTIRDANRLPDPPAPAVPAR